MAEVDVTKRQWSEEIQGVALGEEFVEFADPETLIADFDIDPEDGEISVYNVTVQGDDCTLGRKIAAAIKADKTMIRLIEKDIKREIEHRGGY